MDDDVHRRDSAMPRQNVGDLSQRIAFAIEQIGPRARLETGNQAGKIGNLAIDEDELPHRGLLVRAAR